MTSHERRPSKIFRFCRLGVAHHFVFDPIVIIEIESRPGFIILMRIWPITGGNYLCLDLVQIIHNNRQMVQRPHRRVTVFIGLITSRLFVQRDITIPPTNLDTARCTTQQTKQRNAALAHATSWGIRQITSNARLQCSENT